MSVWTYSGDPATSSHDELRFRLGDTNENDPLLNDSEIDFCVARGGHMYGMLALAADAIAFLYSRETNIKISPLQIDYNNRAKMWTMRADEYRKRAAQLGYPVIQLSQAAKDAEFNDPDRTGPYFRLGMHDQATPPNFSTVSNVE